MSPIFAVAQRAFAAWEQDSLAAPLLAALEVIAATSTDPSELWAAKALADDAALRSWLARDWLDPALTARFEELATRCGAAARANGAPRGWLALLFGRRRRVGYDKTV